MGRGNRGAEIFREDRDREIFIDTLVETVDRTGWLIHAWVLMSTHYHILLETPEANLVAGMRWFPGTFTQRYNAYHQEYGHLFQGRYKAKLIDDEEPSYFRSVADYIHLNPATAGLLDPENPDLATYRWSSFPDYLNPPSKHPSWLETGRVFSCHHIQRNTPTGRRAFEALMAEKTQWVLREKGRRVWQKQWRQHDRGWIHGDCRGGAKSVCVAVGPSLEFKRLPTEWTKSTPKIPQPNNNRVERRDGNRVVIAEDTQRPPLKIGELVDL